MIINNYLALIAAIFGIIVIIRSVIIGSVSPDGHGFRRDEQPTLFWSILFIIVTIDLWLFYIAVFVNNN